MQRYKNGSCRSAARAWSRSSPWNEHGGGSATARMQCEGRGRKRKVGASEKVRTSAVGMALDSTTWSTKKQGLKRGAASRCTQHAEHIGHQRRATSHARKTKHLDRRDAGEDVGEGGVERVVRLWVAFPATCTSFAELDSSERVEERVSRGRCLGQSCVRHRQRQADRELLELALRCPLVEHLGELVPACVGLRCPDVAKVGHNDREFLQSGNSSLTSVCLSTTRRSSGSKLVNMSGESGSPPLLASEYSLTRTMRT